MEIEEGVIINSIQERALAVSWEVAGRSRGVMQFGDGGGQQFLQSALNRAVLCLCDCQVGHYFLIRALFPYVALIGLNMLLPLACCPNAIRPLFHCAAIFTAVISTQSPIGPRPMQPPPPSTPTPPLAPPYPPPPFRFNECPFTARRKGHAKLVVSIVNHPNSDWFQWNKWVVAASKKAKVYVEVAN